MSTKTFWLEPVGRERVALRRYASAGGAWDCAGGWHEAITWTGEEIGETLSERGHREPPPRPDHDDPRWPTECSKGCGYQFTDTDAWQAWGGALYRRTDTGELRVLHSTLTPPDVPGAEAGATWDAAAWRGYCVGPDGIALMVRCPRPDGSPGENDWCVDDKSRSGAGWTRTGDPRAANVTAGPSIAIGVPGEPGYYHGFLQAGVLTDHLG